MNTYPPPAHPLSELALSYALGAMTQSEARAFEEHIAEGCAPCEGELRSFEQTVDALGYGTTEVEPPSSTRANLILKLNESKLTRGKTEFEFTSILASEGDWVELLPGIRLKQLYVDSATGIATSLVRMMPGTALPPHQHIGVEQFLVLEGDCHVRGQRLGPGDYHRAGAGSIHETTFTNKGTLLLLVAPESYEVLSLSPE